MDIFELVAIIAVAVVLFLALREVFVWYWKLNQIVANQKTQIELMKRQNELLEEALGKRASKEVYE